MKELKKINASNETIVSLRPRDQICGVCLVPGNSTSGHYEEVREISQY